MRSIKELLQLLLDTIESYQPIDGNRIFMLDDAGNMGLCACISDMGELHLIELEESELLEDYLDKKGRNCFYRECTYYNSMFYFPIMNWSIRIKWLNELINE